MVTLDATHVEKTYGGRVPVRALRDATVTIQQGEYVAIEGPSGSGKSTLLNLLALLDTPTGGTYTVDEVDVAALSDADRARLRSQTFAFIFQSFHLLENRTVVDNVALGSLYLGLSESERRRAALEALGFVGLEHKADQKANNLSGGERQRVAIARAITSRAAVVVADEPTGNLDTANGEAVMETLERLGSSGTTIIVVTHDERVASRASRRLHVVDGIVSETPRDSQERRTVTPQGAVGKSSTVRIVDALLDAWRGLWAKPSRTVALISSVALGVALALTTAGLAQTSQAQVSDIFDTARNQWVSITSGTAGDSAASRQAASSESLVSIQSLAGVESAATFVTHQDVAVSGTPQFPSTRENPAIISRTLVGMVDKEFPAALFTVDSGGDGFTSLHDDEAIIGEQLASEIDLGPLLASPHVWVEGRPLKVVGILKDAGLQVGLMAAVITTENTAAELSAARYASGEIRVVPGAASQVAEQVPIAWVPAAPETVSVDAPPDPASMRAEIESNVTTMLLTLTAVALLAAVLSLTSAMTTAVFQRTGEFGLRRAMGARRLHITSLVLTESLGIGALGGIIGAYVSLLAVLVITIARQWQPVIDPTLIPLGIGGGVVVGLMGGLIATRRASAIQPSDALRA